MKLYAIKALLKADQAPVLPLCTFERFLSCSQCIYFETHSPDSNGQCRCSYKGRWYYPHEGCTNGSMTFPQTLYGPPPTSVKDRTDRKKKNPLVRLLIVLMILIAALLAVIYVFPSLNPLIPCLVIAVTLFLALRSPH